MNPSSHCLCDALVNYSLCYAMMACMSCDAMIKYTTFDVVIAGTSWDAMTHYSSCVTSMQGAHACSTLLEPVAALNAT